jgi:hypothetical protein
MYICMLLQSSRFRSHPYLIRNQSYRTITIWVSTRASNFWINSVPLGASGEIIYWKRIHAHQKLNQNQNKVAAAARYTAKITSEYSKMTSEYSGPGRVCSRTQGPIYWKIHPPPWGNISWFHWGKNMKRRRGKGGKCKRKKKKGDQWKLNFS